MRIKRSGAICFALLGLAIVTYAGMARANEVLLTANQPTSIIYKVAHKKLGAEPEFSELQYAVLSNNVNVHVDLGNYDRAGVVIMSINGRELPSSVNQFDKPQQCSMTTDKTKATGALELEIAQHKFTCRTFGGVFA